MKLSAVVATNLSVAMMCKYGVQLQYAGQSRVAGDDLTLVSAQVHHFKHLDRQGYEIPSLQ